MDCRKKLENFWFYYKKPLLIALAALLVLAYLGIQRVSSPKPDYHIGLICSVPRMDEELDTLEDTIAAAGTDLNGDGQILVKLHAYYLNLSHESVDSGVNSAETVAALDADLIGGVSGIFLLEDVDAFRRVTNDVLSDSVSIMGNGLHLTIRKDAADTYIALAEKLS